MARNSERTLRVSSEKLNLVKNALLKFPSQADLAAELQMSRTTVHKFKAGQPVQRREFHKICKKLKLKWEEVADLSSDAEDNSGAISQTTLPQPTALQAEKIANTHQDSVGRELNITSPINGIPKVIRTISNC